MCSSESRYVTGRKEKSMFAGMCGVGGGGGALFSLEMLQAKAVKGLMHQMDHRCFNMRMQSLTWKTQALTRIRTL